MQKCKTKTCFFQDRSAPESLHQCRFFWALEAQGVASKHPRVGSIPYFGVCPLADQVFDSTYRGAPQAGDGWSGSHAQCKHKRQAAADAIAHPQVCRRHLRRTDYARGLCKDCGSSGRLCRPTNHLVQWKRMRPL